MSRKEEDHCGGSYETYFNKIVDEKKTTLASEEKMQGVDWQSYQPAYVIIKKMKDDKLEFKTAFSMWTKIGNSLLLSKQYPYTMKYDEEKSKETISVTSYPTFVVDNFKINRDEAKSMVGVVSSKKSPEFASAVKKMRHYFDAYGGYPGFARIFIDGYAKKMYTRESHKLSELFNAKGPCFRFLLYYLKERGILYVRDYIAFLYKLASGYEAGEKMIDGIMESLRLGLKNIDGELLDFDEDNMLSTIMFLAESADTHIMEYQQAFHVLMELIDKLDISYVGLQMIVMICNLVLEIGSVSIGSIISIDSDEKEILVSLGGKNLDDERKEDIIKRYLIRKFNMNWALTWELSRLSGINKRNEVRMIANSGENTYYFGDYYVVNGKRSNI